MKKLRKKLTAVVLAAVVAFAGMNFGGISGLTQVAAETVDAFTVEGGSQGMDYDYTDNVLTIKSATPITIKNTDPAKATTHRIEVASGTSVNITLAGVNIDVSSSNGTAAFKIADDSTGDVTITLADGSENTLKSGKNCAGLQKNSDTSTGTLTIQGGTNGTGKLTATGGESGAGLGGGLGYFGSNIKISGGTVTATSVRWGAGIGGGSDHNGSNIKISGGTVTATGRDGAGIGGGNGGSGSNIEISGGSVKAVAGAGAGANDIGGGADKEAVPPTLADGKTPVYLLEIANDRGAGISINNNAYPAEHTYYDFDSLQYVTEKKIYAYLPAKTVTDPNVVAVGTETTKYVYGNSKWLIVPVAKNNLVYTGEEQALVTAETTSGGTMVYSLARDGAYTAAIPTGKNAGIYTVWYKVIDGDAYADTFPASVEVTIAKAAPVITNADTVKNQSTVFGSGEFVAPAADVEGRYP